MSGTEPETDRSTGSAAERAAERDTDRVIGCDDTADLPCAGALVASTVAWMTLWADPCPDCTVDPTAQRTRLARQIVSSLFFLQRHPALGAELRQVMTEAHARWVRLATQPATPSACAEAGGDAPARRTPAATKALH